MAEAAWTVDPTLNLDELRAPAVLPGGPPWLVAPPPRVAEDDSDVEIWHLGTTTGATTAPTAAEGGRPAAELAARREFDAVLGQLQLSDRARERAAEELSRARTLLRKVRAELSRKNRQLNDTLQGRIPSGAASSPTGLTSCSSSFTRRGPPEPQPTTRTTFGGAT